MGNIWIGPWANFPQYMDPTFHRTYLMIETFLFFRSALKYIYFSKRHFDCDVHMQNPWLEQHFALLYSTIQPGFNYTVGMADSSQLYTWGPESQLYFLDSYVLKNGSGNWLAQVINNRTTKSSRWINPLLTDFVFYNPEYTAVPPNGFDKPHHHTFQDWSVTTYRSDGFLNNGTFAAFKSGALRGEYMHNLSKVYPEFIRLTNPGHEHPDQNSFVLTFHGKSFITDGFYGAKLTRTNNVHMFYPSEVII